jgi:hypothetical protein
LVVESEAADEWPRPPNQKERAEVDDNDNGLDRNLSLLAWPSAIISATAVSVF